MEETVYLQKNIKLYQKINYAAPFVIFWALVVPFYRSKGLDFTQIALLQTVGSMVDMALEIPLGWYSDRYGYRKTLLIGGFAFLGGTIFLIFGHSMPALLVSELLFALYMAAESGADTAIFYGSLELLGKTEAYLEIQSRISQKQSIIRFFMRILAPVLYSFMPAAPFALSLVPYGLIIGFTFRYTELSQPALEQSEKGANPSAACRNTASSKIKGFFSLNSTFALLCVFSMLMMVIESNYAQFFAPYLDFLNIDIQYYGVVTAGGTLASFLGARWVLLWGQKSDFQVLTLCGCLICLLMTGSSLLNTSRAAIPFYFLLNLLGSQFYLYLNKSINRVIPSNRRATMLSLANIFDQCASVLCDPLIGLGLDRLGFKNIYCVLGITGFVTYTILWVGLTHYARQTADTGESTAS